MATKSIYKFSDNENGTILERIDGKKVHLIGKEQDYLDNEGNIKWNLLNWVFDYLYVPPDDYWEFDNSFPQPKSIKIGGWKL